jgi:hypothetical protein
VRFAVLPFSAIVPGGVWSPGSHVGFCSPAIRPNNGCIRACYRIWTVCAGFWDGSKSCDSASENPLEIINRTGRDLEIVIEADRANHSTAHSSQSNPTTNSGWGRLKVAPHREQKNNPRGGI